MTRDIPATLEQAVEGNFGWVLMLKIVLDSETVYAHTGVGEIEWDGQVWLGVGNMAQISGMVETPDGGDNRITVGLSGIPVEAMPDFVFEFTEEDTTGRQWVLYIGELDEDGNLQGDAVELNAGLTGAVDLIDGPTRTVTLSLITEAALMKSILFYRMTDEDQQFLFPGDLGFGFMSSLGDNINTGSGDTLRLPNGNIPTEPEAFKSREQ